MKIYYLSATGNSLTAARSLARELDEDVTLVSFRSIRLLPEIETEDTAVGFIFPAYFADMQENIDGIFKKTEKCHSGDSETNSRYKPEKTGL